MKWNNCRYVLSFEVSISAFIIQFIEGNFTSANSNYSIAVQNKILAARLNSIGYTAQKIADADALTLQSQLNASVTLATIFTDTTTPNFTNMQRFMLLDQVRTLILLYLTQYCYYRRSLYLTLRYISDTLIIRSISKSKHNFDHY